MKNQTPASLLLCLLLGGACAHDQPVTKAAAPEKMSPNTVPAAGLAANPQSSQELEFTFPVVWLTPAVDDLNLRVRPDVDAQVAAQIQVGNMLKWTGNVSDHKDKIALRGQALALPWLEVTNIGGVNPISWVYQGGVRPVWMSLGFEVLLPDSVLTNPWVTVGPIDSTRFIRCKKQAGDQVLRRWEDTARENGNSGPRDSTPVRLALGDSVRVFKDHLNMGEGFLNHIYVGQQNRWHIVARLEWEYSDLLLVSALDGTECPTMGYSSFWPLASPDGRCWAFPSWQEFEYGVGLEIFNLDTRQSFFFALSEPVEDLVWASNHEIYFKTFRSDDDPGRYHRLTFVQIFR